MPIEESSDRALLASLTRHLDETIVTDAELDQWAAKLAAEPSRYKRGRIIMQQFIPWLTDRMRAGTVRKMTAHGARHPSTN
jgi:hypothetical protein